MSHKHKPPPLPCLVAIAITLLCSVAKPAQCDINKNLRTPEIYSKLNELANDRVEYLNALWPSDEELTRYGVNLSIVPPAVVEDATGWIRRVVKHKWLPPDLDTKLIAVKDWVRRERSVQPPKFAFAVIVDALIAEFRIKEYNIQIQENDRRLGVLIFPVKPNQVAANIEDYITDSISTFLNVPSSKLDSCEYTLKYSQNGKNNMMYYGQVWCEWDMRKLMGDANKYRTWWNYMLVCTDGNLIFFGVGKSLPTKLGRIPPSRARTTEDHPRF